VDELTLTLVGFLLTATVLASILYYQRLRRAQREYEKARSAVDDVLLSFNRQFEREDKRLEFIAYKVEALTSKVDSGLSVSEDVSKRMNLVQSKISVESEGRSQITQRLYGAEKKVGELTASQEVLMNRVSSLEQRPQQILTTPEVNLQGVIPIRREKAMSQLTDTEVSVLEMLAAEGSKTAPEIKERVKLSREHTARLMKNLYEEGYLDRETEKIPFRYSVKREMEKLLKKTESQASQPA
jgi:DNA-binding MarR family transcriptional regulator